MTAATVMNTLSLPARSPASSASIMALNPASKPALGDFFNSLLVQPLPGARRAVERRDDPLQLFHHLTEESSRHFDGDWDAVGGGEGQDRAGIVERGADPDLVGWDDVAVHAVGGFLPAARGAPFEGRAG